MVVDLKFEVFSFNLFHRAWLELGFTKDIMPRYKNYEEVTNPIPCPDNIIKAVYFRRNYLNLNPESADYDFEQYSKCNLEFYLHLHDIMTNNIPCRLNVNLQVFDKLITACCVLMQMAFICVKNNSQVYKNCIPLCWGMYFDIECKEEFYDEGGWIEFENHAKSYGNAYFLPLTYYGNCDADGYDPEKMYFFVIDMEYSLDLIEKKMKEKIINGKSCLHCDPLFYVMLTNYGLSNDVVNKNKLIEGYLQLLSRFLSQIELKECQRNLYQEAGLEDCWEMMNNYSKCNDDEKFYLGEITSQILPEYKKRNTNIFLSRVFSSQEDLNTDHCMFCGRNTNKLSNDVTLMKKHRKEKIISVIHNTQLHIDVKSDESGKVIDDSTQDPNLEKNIKEVLQLFSCLGTQPGTSRILSNLRKRSENQLNEENISVNTQKAFEVKGKGKRNRRKKKIDKDY